LNLKQLNLFQNIAELKSMSRAASVLHVSQSLLSRQMQSLEKDLGVLLFVRSDKGVRLTPAGQTLLDRSYGILKQVSQLEEELGHYAIEPKGDLRIGLPPSLFDLVSVPLVDEYCNSFPEVRLTFHEGISTWLHEAVLTGRLHTALVSDAEPLGLLISRPILIEQLFLVGSLKDGLRSDRPVLAESLSDRRLVLTTESNAIRKIVDTAMQKSTKKSKPILETNSSRMLLELVTQGQGFTVLPFSAIALAYEHKRVTISPVKDLFVTWTLITPRDQTLSLAGHKMHKNLKEICRKQVQTGKWLGAQCL
jgi:LysR family nitrogen assimilation transcriptional regulator